MRILKFIGGIIAVILGAMNVTLPFYFLVIGEMHIINVLWRLFIGSIFLTVGLAWLKGDTLGKSKAHSLYSSDSEPQPGSKKRKRKNPRKKAEPPKPKSEYDFYK